MGLSDKFLSKSNSFQFYKKNFERLNKENKILKDEIKDKDKEIKKLENNLNLKNLSKKASSHKRKVQIRNPDFENPSASTQFQERILTKEEFDKVLQDDKYYEKRWGYYEEVIEVLKAFDDVESVLEIGPYKIPFVRGSDIIDLSDEYVGYYPLEINEFIQHDGSQVPYPIDDKRYDLIIACQVVEHLGLYGEQKKVFDEFERISKRLIMTLPYMWYAPEERDHHMVDERMISIWSGKRKPVYEVIHGNRILQVYDFD